MPEPILRDRRILVVADELLLADELGMELLDHDAIVIVPAGTVEMALELIRTEPWIDGAMT